MVAEIDAASAAFAEEHKLPGLVAGIVDQDRLVHVTALGLADRPATGGKGHRLPHRLDDQEHDGARNPLASRCRRGRARCASVTVIPAPERRPRIQKLIVEVADMEEGEK